MKRNEEYTIGEKFCSAPFFFPTGEKVYELLEDFEIRHESLGMYCQKWRVLESTSRRIHDYWVEEHKPFGERDFVE